MSGTVPWCQCVCLIKFDVHHGPTMTYMYPSSALSASESKNVAHMCLPEGERITTGRASVHTFILRKESRQHASRIFEDAPFSDATATSRNIYLFGAAWFIQLRCHTNQRGYEQVAVATLVKQAYPQLCKHISALLGSKYLQTRSTILFETAFKQLEPWSTFQPGSVITVPLLGRILKYSVPHYSISTSILRHQTHGFLASHARQFSHSSAVLSANGIGELSIFVHLRPFLKRLWHLWCLVITGRSIIVHSSRASVCSDVALTIASLIAPLDYAGELRPYTTIHDIDATSIARQMERGSIDRDPLYDSPSLSGKSVQGGTDTESVSSGTESFKSASSRVESTSIHGSPANAYQGAPLTMSDDMARLALTPPRRNEVRIAENRCPNSSLGRGKPHSELYRSDSGGIRGVWRNIRRLYRRDDGTHSQHRRRFDTNAPERRTRISSASPQLRAAVHRNVLMSSGLNGSCSDIPGLTLSADGENIAHTSKYINQGRAMVVGGIPGCIVGFTNPMLCSQFSCADAAVYIADEAICTVSDSTHGNQSKEKRSRARSRSADCSSDISASDGPASGASRELDHAKESTERSMNTAQGKLRLETSSNATDDTNTKNLGSKTSRHDQSGTESVVIRCCDRVAALAPVATKKYRFHTAGKLIIRKTQSIAECINDLQSRTKSKESLLLISRHRALLPRDRTMLKQLMKIPAELEEGDQLRLRNGVHEHRVKSHMHSTRSHIVDETEVEFEDRFPSDTMGSPSSLGTTQMSSDISLGDIPAATINNTVLRRHFLELTSAFLQPFSKYFSLSYAIASVDSVNQTPQLVVHSDSKAVSSRGSSKLESSQLKNSKYGAYDSLRDSLLKSFHPQQFLNDLQRTDIPKSIRNGDWRDLYRQFMKTATFAIWFNKQRANSEDELFAIARALRLSIDRNMLFALVSRKCGEYPIQEVIDNFDQELATKLCRKIILRFRDDATHIMKDDVLKKHMLGHLQILLPRLDDAHQAQLKLADIRRLTSGLVSLQDVT